MTNLQVQTNKLQQISGMRVLMKPSNNLKNIGRNTFEFYADNNNVFTTFSYSKALAFAKGLSYKSKG